LGAGTLQYGSPSGLGRSGTGYLKVDGKIVSTQKIEKTVPMLLQWCENFDVGADTGSPVADKDYQVPFRFTGKLDKLTLTIDRPKLSPEDIQKLEAAMHANPASE
jgi:arylsulfatase